MSQPYEIELVLHDIEESPLDWHLAQLATVTGLSKAEILTTLPAEYVKQGKWRSRGYVDCARALGFNCNPRFIKWDAATPWPAIMRVQVPDDWGWKGSWWSLIYHQGQVYNVSHRPHVQRFEHWQRDHPGCRVTSMLQIWMSDSTSLLLPSER